MIKLLFKKKEKTPCGITKRSIEKKINYFTFMFTIWLCIGTNLLAQNKPFPQQNDWENCIKPNNIGQSQLNADVIAFYEIWKGQYLRETDMEGGYYVHGECTGCTELAKGTSEGHGWGMIITVLMAGYDANAKTYYDGLYNYFDAHRSPYNTELMSWMVEYAENGGEHSATDGDLDIAYSLLLAHDQWGSDGPINYLQEAIDMISDGLKVSDMNQSSYRVMRGTWDTNPYSTRSSDWMTAQFRAYSQATEDGFWNAAINTAYSIMQTIQNNHSPTTGLMPDFVVGANPEPAPPYELESQYDGDFYWNACRFPWRVAMDYAHYGTPDAKIVSNKIVNWAKEITNNNPANFKAGYTLEGEEIAAFSSTAYIAPLLVASIVDADHQDFLNSGWGFIKDSYYSYYDASINMLCMLVISGNWWIPQSESNVVPVPVSFVPDPNKKYHIDVPEHNLRLAATGESEDPYTASINTTGNDVEWQFVDKGNGYWHIQRAAGGTVARLRSDNSEFADMQASSFSGGWTYYDFSSGVSDNTFFITLPDGPSNYKRLQVDNNGSVKMVAIVNAGVWESFSFTEVEESTQQKAYKNHTIPGTIQAEDYDIGNIGEAYYDTTSGNSGNQYRNNEDVDVEVASGDSPGEYNVGWTADGEWLEYTISSINAGTYDIIMRVASFRTYDKSISLSLDGQNLGTIAVAYTGGWQNWQTLTIPNVQLSGGTNQVLRISFAGGGFNLNYIDFQQTTISENTYTISAKGTSGEEQLALVLNGTTAAVFDLTTNWQAYSATSNIEADHVIIEYINDSYNRDAELDYLLINGIAFQAEDQITNTSVYQNASCGGSYSQYMHCPGYIEFKSAAGKGLNNTGMMTFEDLGILVYPNPAQNNMTIDLGKNVFEEASLTIYDTLGRKFSRLSLFETQKTIDVSGLPKGIYFITISSNVNNITSSFIKE